MRAVVVYESMYGNTHRIADAIGEGLSTVAQVEVLSVAEASLEGLGDADLIVVGGPTHVHGMSRPSTRSAAVKAAHKTEGILSVEPNADAFGVHEWLEGRGSIDCAVAAFDTRMGSPAWLTGRASRRIARLLRRHGARSVSKPESFLVTKGDTLRAGEEDRARAWGAALAVKAGSRQ